jgi:TetR/AcrR family transcriptional regulator, transcriptional repressor of aconitase
MARTVNHEQHQIRREAITSAAAALFAKQGFAETSTADVAKAAGISTGSLFYYFPDKAAIFRAIFEQDIPESRRLFEAHDETNDPAASILDIVAALANPARDELAPGLLVELLRRAGNDPQLMEIVVANEAIVQDGLASLVRRAAANGQVDEGLDPAAAATWIRTIIDAVYLNAGDGADVDPIPMLQLIIARFLEIDTGSESTRRRKGVDTSE